jgi:DNA end-binding protein Ku
MPRPFWSGTLSFGLVSIPVNLYPANRSNRAALRMLGSDGQPLARRYYSQETGRDLDADEMVRGYQLKKGKYVEVTDEELERLAPSKTRDIDLRRFVKRDEISPLFFDRAYFLTPAEGSEKAYRLLAESMAKSGHSGIATFVMRGKEYLVAISPDHGILRAETLRFADELRSPKEIGLPSKKAAPKATLHRFEKLIDKHAKAHLSRAELKDEQTARVLKLVQAKRKRRKDVVKTDVPQSTPGNVVDMMEVLRRSLSGKRK